MNTKLLLNIFLVTLLLGLLPMVAATNVKVDGCIMNLSTTTSGRTTTSIINGLTAFYPLNGNANDVIGGNNGTVIGSVSWNDYALSLVGVNNNYISVPREMNIQLNNNFTVNFWINTSDKTLDKKILTEFSGGSWGEWTIKNNNGMIYILKYSENDISSNNSLKLNITDYQNQWKLITIGRNGTDGFACMDSSNCVYANLFAANEEIINFEPLIVGCSNLGTTCMNGSLSGLRFYNRSLSQTEVNTIYSEGRTATTSSGGNCKTEKPKKQQPPKRVKQNIKIVIPHSNNGDEAVYLYPKITIKHPDKIILK